MPVPKKPVVDWVNLAIYGGMSLLTVVVWSLAFVGFAYLMGWLR